MEPMTLGSPMSSPIQSPGSPGSSSPYLPSFLLGDTNTPAKINIMSPQDNPRHLNITNTSLMSSVSYGSPDYRSNRQKAVFGSTTTPSTPQMSTKNHAGGPPTRGLFDTLEVTHVSLPPATSITNPVITTTPVNQSRLMMSPLTTSLIFPDSSITLNTSESQGLLQWVTVFGFLPTDINAVLSHISSRVRIVEKHPAPQPQSNWIHLKCASEQEAQKALACNGSIVSGTIMIGIIPCTDEGVILCSDKENRTKLNGSMRSLSAGRITQSPFSASPTARRRKLRSLAAGYNQHFSPQAAQLPENVPQKSGSLVSKAMEYMFGW
ncbi:nucleoporin NUP35 [Pogonomyrmex barbatus]|uniref:Nucleoporin NUP53 n=1 Tax=Pogonomyrmex barbatus TaxID=144034 RepID=A0A6I9W9I2_9HYME|nr:nucleoporin NUP35 [Pogonomyrmex barbatus]